MAQTVSVLGGTLELAMEGSGGQPPRPWDPNFPTPPIHIPEPPPGVWPPPVPAHPIVPAPPMTPPGMIWPGVPTHPIAPGGPPPGPSQGPGFPTPPGPIVPPEGGQPPEGGGQPPESGGTPGHPLPQKFWVLALVPGYGWYYLCVDPAAAFAVSDPPHPAHPLPQPPQPTPQRRTG